MNPNLKATTARFPSFLSRRTFVASVKSPVSCVELTPVSERLGTKEVPRDFTSKKFWSAPSTSTSTIFPTPMRRSTTPTEVSSPRRPESGNPTSCKKSKPISVRSVPAGTVSASTVRKGRSCARVLELKTAKAINANAWIRRFRRAMAVILREADCTAKKIRGIKSLARTPLLFLIIFEGIVHRCERRRNCSFRAENQAAQRGFFEPGLPRREQFFICPSAFRSNRQCHRVCGAASQNFLQRTRVGALREHNF